MYQNLSEEEKYKCQNGHEHYKNFPESDKQRLVEYRKSYSRMQKVNKYLILSLMITDHCINLQEDFFEFLCLYKYFY